MVKELYDVMVIYLVNGVVIVLVEVVSDFEENFIKLMNEMVKRLNMGELKFVNFIGFFNFLLKGMYLKGMKKEDENFLLVWVVVIFVYYLIYDYSEFLEVVKIFFKMFR